MKIGHLHKGDYIKTRAGAGYIVSINRKNNSLKVKLEALGDMPPASIKAELVEEIIRAKTEFILNLYDYRADSVETYRFNALEDARAKKEELYSDKYSAYLIFTRDRDTRDFIEEIEEG